MAQDQTKAELAHSSGLRSKLALMRLALAFLVFAGNAAASCYQLFDQSDAKIYEGSTPPFDISYPGNSPAYNASRGRGEYLMILPGSFCAPVYAEEGSATGSRRYRGSSPGRGSSGGYRGGRGNGQICSGNRGGPVGCKNGQWICEDGFPSKSTAPCP